jgi:hypothetical protein
MKTRPATVTVTEDEYLIHSDEYDGLCAACGAIAHGGVEPDAENHTCESCGSARVFGFEQALICGFVEIVEG